MSPDSVSFLRALLSAPGPSGFEEDPARIWRAEAQRFADEVRTDVSGNSYATLRAGHGAPVPTPRIMLTGHIDEIGLMVVHIDDDGYAYFDTIGGWDHQVFVGQRVLLLNRVGTVLGVIGKQPIHLLQREDREKVLKPSDLWIDIGARTKAEALERIRVGDAGVLASSVEEFPNGRLVSRSIDNRIGAFVALEALRLLGAKRPKADVTAVATVQEEIAFTGGGARPSATVLDPTVAIVIDVTHATDCPGLEKKRHGDVRLGGGPVIARGSVANPRVFDLLVAAAEADGIPYSIQAAPKDTRTDADAIFNAHRGVPTALVSVPNRYMHSPNEMVELTDVAYTAALLAAFCGRISTTSDFSPRGG